MTTVEDDEEWSLLDPNDETVREKHRIKKNIRNNFRN